ncbi:olfactory receptor 10A7-like [Tachyglossus aculeatus]|uniref:olfactory receptor 10A7-like n=1 Tax=Tachyglossus aculeatus TaxID=9261 RepID=UPI0018F7C1BB|nr:olfactory receptor 10A7-like [Tachyglossus aculeatus]
MLFIIFLFYLVTVSGSVVIITVICLEPRLQKLVYFFLANLSFLDMTYTFTNVPQMLSNLVGDRKAISFTGCVTQMYFSLSFGMTECVLLGVMAYDQYVAMYHQLHYTLIMNRVTCVQLGITSWISSFLSSLVINAFTLSLPYCGPSVLNHFFCEVPTVLRLAFTDTSFLEMVVFVFSIIIVFIPFLFNMVSYAQILLSIFGRHSTAGRCRAFSMCVSHLTVVALFYEMAIFVYMRPQSGASQAGRKVIPLVYTVITSMLNPRSTA